MSSYFQCLFTTFNILICITKLFLFIIWLNLATTWLYLLYLCSRSQASIVQFFCRELWQCDLGLSPSHCILHMYIPVYMQQTMKYFFRELEGERENQAIASGILDIILHVKLPANIIPVAMRCDWSCSFFYFFSHYLYYQ